jgi:hypothetical protein
MNETYAKRKITQLDMYMGGALFIVSLVLVINISLRSITLVYGIILIVLGGIAYAAQYRGLRLKNLWTLGLLSIILYPFIDYLFVANLGLVSYMTKDPRLVVTPVYVPLYWLLGVLLFVYCYYRIHGVTEKVWMGALGTGLFSAASTTLVENLFNAMGFYQNTPSHYMIGHIPVYVPLGYVVAFSLMPLYLRYKYVFGFLLYGLVGICWYVFSFVVP